MMPDGTLYPAHDGYTLPSIAEVGLEECSVAGGAWQELGQATLHNLHEIGTELEFRAQYPNYNFQRWVEIAELGRCIGEATLTVVAALAEVAGLIQSTNPKQPHTNPTLAGFTSEATAQYLVSIGHNLANLGLRIAEEHSACNALLAGPGSTKGIRTALRQAPGADHPAAWIFHSQAVDMAAALTPSRSAPASFVKTVSRLFLAKDWTKVNLARNQYFHRWRQSFAFDGYAAASAYHRATLRAALCLGRALPALYNQFMRSSPKDNDVPLVPRISVSTWSDGLQISDSVPALTTRRFRG